MKKKRDLIAYKLYIDLACCVKSEHVVLNNYIAPKGIKIYFAVTDKSIALLKQFTAHFAGQPFAQEWLNKHIHNITLFRPNGTIMIQSETHERMISLNLTDDELG